jgi:hypothetical protein
MAIWYSLQSFGIFSPFLYVLTIEILGLEGESTNEKWTIFFGYQGKFIMVLPSAARLDRLLLKNVFQ